MAKLTKKQINQWCGELFTIEWKNKICRKCKSLPYCPKIAKKIILVNNLCLANIGKYIK